MESGPLRTGSKSDSPSSNAQTKPSLGPFDDRLGAPSSRWLDQHGRAIGPSRADRSGGAPAGRTGTGLATSRAILEAYRYEILAGQIERSVRDGVHRPGAKLKSVRDVRAATGVSLATVQKAYELLEQRGVIETRPNAGHFVRPRADPDRRAIAAGVPALGPPIDALVIRSFIRATQSASFVQLTEAMPSTEALPVKRLARSMRRALREHEMEVCCFADPQGHPPLREKIAQLMGLSLGHASSEEIIITNGGMESWNLCLRALTKPGDHVLIQSAVYFGVLEILESLGLGFSIIPEKNGAIDLDALDELLHTRTIDACFLVPNFVGISGHPIGEELKPALVRLLAEHRVPIIEDDIYGDLFFDMKRPTKLRALDRNIIHCGSFSKSLAPGFRCAWIAAGPHLDDVLRQKFITSISSPTITQLIVADFLDRSRYERQLRSMRRELARHLGEYHTIIKRYFPAATRVIRPPIGSSLWVELPEGVDSEDLYYRSLADNVAVAPGTIHSADRGLRRFLRLSFARPMSARIEEALRIVGGHAGRR